MKQNHSPGRLHTRRSFLKFSSAAAAAAFLLGDDTERSLLGRVRLALADNAAFAEDIEHEVTGLVVPDNTAEGLQRAIARMLDEDALREGILSRAWDASAAFSCYRFSASRSRITWAMPVISNGLWTNGTSASSIPVRCKTSSV